MLALHLIDTQAVSWDIPSITVSYRSPATVGQVQLMPCAGKAIAICSGARMVSLHSGETVHLSTWAKEPSYAISLLKLICVMELNWWLHPHGQVAPVAKKCCYPLIHLPPSSALWFPPFTMLHSLHSTSLHNHHLPSTLSHHSLWGRLPVEKGASCRCQVDVLSWWLFLGRWMTGKQWQMGFLW